MRRPLFVVCLCLVVLLAFGEGMQPFGCSLFCPEEVKESTEDEVTLQSFLEEWSGRELVITGRVYQKDTKQFYLENISINSVNQKVLTANLQWTISNSNYNVNNFICDYGECAYGDAGTLQTGARSTDGMEMIRLGSEVTIRGTVYPFPEATNPGSFDAKSYYASLGIVGKVEDVLLLEAGEEYSVCQESLYRVKEYFRNRLYHIFPKKEAGIMTAMLLGDKSGLDDEVKALYQENGIIHILSISGLHITIIGMSLYQLLRRVGTQVLPAAVLGSVVIILYGIMTGMSVSTARAIGMYLIHMLAELAGRTYDMLNALGLMAVFMLWQNPQNLENVGFLLSYGAVLGIGVMYPAMLIEGGDGKNVFYEEKKWKQRFMKFLKGLLEELKQSLMAGMSITITTLPILLWFYYEVPVYSIFLNLLVLPFMSMVMLAGLLAMLVPGLGFVGTLDCVVLTGYEWLCQVCEKLPFHKWNPGRPQVWQIAAYYVVWCLVVLLGQVRRKEKEKRESFKTAFVRKEGVICGKLQILGMLLAVFVFEINIFKETVVTFLDVGQGDCICIQLASGEVYLFDCGSSSRSNVGEYVLKPFLKYYGIQHIDGVFVSHPDEDHCNGIEELLVSGEEWGITVGQLILPDIQDKMRDEKFLELQKTAEGMQGTTEMGIYYVNAGDMLETEDFSLLCLHPPAAWECSDSNAYSECFWVEFHAVGKTLLLTGDVEGEGEMLLLEELGKRNLHDVDILKVAHHGSRNSSSEALLAQLTPQLSVISCGENNGYGHPHKETLERLKDKGCKVLSTSEYGAVSIEFGKEKNN